MDISEIKGKVDFGIITIRDDEYRAILERFTPIGLVKDARWYRISQVQTDASDFYLVAIVRCPEQGTGVAHSSDACFVL